MKNNFAPMLITTPRTGSSLLAHYLAEIGKQTANYQNNLSEYFDVAPWNNLRFKTFKHFGKNIIGLESNQNILKLENNPYDAINSIEYKFNMLQENKFKYMIKIIPYNLNTDILEYCAANYNFVYLERLNKKEQLLSYMAMLDSGLSHYNLNSDIVIKKFKFDIKFLYVLNDIYKEYHNIKNRFPGITLIYENIFYPEVNLNKIIQNLNLNYDLDTNSITSHYTQKTTYASLDYEELILNKDEYYKCEKEMLSILSTW